MSTAAHEHHWGYGGDGGFCTICQIDKDEWQEQRIAALEAENARMREIVAAVVNMPMPFDDSWDELTCPFCDYTEDVNDDRPSVPHTADCPVTKARAILAGDTSPQQERPTS